MIIETFFYFRFFQYLTCISISAFTALPSAHFNFSLAFPIIQNEVHFCCNVAVELRTYKQRLASIDQHFNVSITDNIIVK